MFLTQEKNVSYADLGTFSLNSYPFSALELELIPCLLRVPYAFPRASMVSCGDHDFKPYI